MPAGPPTDADGVREAWDILERLWQRTVGRGRGMAPDLLHERVEGEWSFIETLRHLRRLQAILNEEWEHRLYAERDFDVLESRSP